MKIIITEVSNGYVIERMINNERVFTVVEDTIDDEHYEARLNYKLLRILQDTLEYYPSKHNQVNCRVILEGEVDE